MQRLAFEGLEPCDGKLSCPVLRGLGVSNDPRLPGLLIFSIYHRFMEIEILVRYSVCRDCAMLEVPLEEIEAHLLVAGGLLDLN